MLRVSALNCVDDGKRPVASALRGCVTLLAGLGALLRWMSLVDMLKFQPDSVQMVEIRVRRE